jgi:hypothetical protein
LDKDILLRLKAALEAKDIDTADGILDELSGLQPDADAKKALASVADYVLAYELKEAADLIDGLLREVD